MSQRSYLGLTYMDIAKAVIEGFLKTRPIDVDGKHYHEKIQLFTTEFSSDDVPFTLLSTYTDTISELDRKLKYIQPHGSKNLIRTLLEILRFIDLYRFSTGIDSITMGRFPYYNEPTIIILISCDMTNLNLMNNWKNIYHNSYINRILVDITGQNSFYYQSYRWDQQFYVIDIAVPGIPHQSKDGLPYKLENCKMMNKFLLHLVLETNGQWVPIFNDITLSNSAYNLNIPNYQQDTNIPIWLIGMSSYHIFNEQFRNRSPYSGSILEYFKSLGSSRGGGYKVNLIVPSGSLNTNLYPIPEEYYPDDLLQGNIPLRDSYPVVVALEKAVPRPICKELIIDKYRIDALQYPNYMIDNLDTYTSCLPCYVINSGKIMNTIGGSFGYLALDEKDGSINLYIAPYNYTVLITLINEWISNRGRINKNWRENLEKYIYSIPYYYIQPVRNALKKIGISISQYVPEINELQFNRRTDKLLRIGKPNAKKMYDSLNVCKITNNFNTLTTDNNILKDYDKIEFNIPYSKLESQPDFRTLLLKQKLPRFNRIDMSKFLFPSFTNVQLNIYHYGRKLEKIGLSNMFTNAFNIPRDSLIPILPDLYDNICKSSINKVKPLLRESIHNMEVNMMGNYRINDSNNLRPIDPTQIRAHSFGNPFKTHQMEYDVKVDETTDTSVISESGYLEKSKESFQYRKQHEYNNRRRRYYSHRIGRIRRSLSQSYLDSLDNMDTGQEPTPVYDIIDDSSSLYEYDSIDEYNHNYEMDNIKITSCIFVHITKKLFINIMKKFIGLIRMHTINIRSIEKFIKKNYNNYDQQLFVYFIKIESIKYRRWDIIKPIIRRYININIS